MRSIKEINYNKSIVENFPGFSKKYVCLFPFYRKVFADNFDWEADLQLTFPLLHPVTWKSVSQSIGFGSLSRVALGVLNLKEPFKTELREFCDFENLNFPDFTEDKVPEIILIPILKYLSDLGHSYLWTKEIERFSGSTLSRIDLKGRDLFQLYNNLRGVKYLETENSISLLIPDYDSPYMLLMGKEMVCQDLIRKTGLETIEVDQNMKFHWWDD